MEVEPKKEEMTDQEFDEWYDNCIDEQTADKPEQTDTQKETNKILRRLLKSVGNFAKTVRDKQKQFDELPEQEKTGKIQPKDYAETSLNLMALKANLDCLRYLVGHKSSNKENSEENRFDNMSEE